MPRQASTLYSTFDSCRYNGFLILLQRRDTHLDQLVYKLNEDRVRRIIQPIILGNNTGEIESVEDDSQYCIDLGLVRKEDGGLVISNQIYQEIIPRVLVYERQLQIIQNQTCYVDAPTKSLMTVKLISAFVEFFKENIDHWGKTTYPEAAPQLLLQAFLQRIINGGGRISREYGLGRGRLDLFIEWPLEADAFLKNGKVQKIIIEFKLLHKGKTLKSTIDSAFSQITEYADHLNVQAELHILIVDRISKKSWKAKTWKKTKKWQGQTIHLWGF